MREKEITMDEAQHLLQLCQGGVIDKRRYLVKSGSHTFEVDEFYGDNEGLVMAEVELASETEVGFPAFNVWLQSFQLFLYCGYGSG